MRWKLNSGVLSWRNDKKYLINWDKPSRSKEQTKVKEFLRQYWEKDVVYEEYRLPQDLLRVDFINASKKITIEHQGKGAHQYNKFFHDNSRAKYLASIKRDVKKRKFLEDNGFLFIETFTEELDRLSKELFWEKYKIVL